MDVEKNMKHIKGNSWLYLGQNNWSTLILLTFLVMQLHITEANKAFEKLNIPTQFFLIYNLNERSQLCKDHNSLISISVVSNGLLLKVFFTEP